MKAYIVDTQKHIIENTYPDASYASYAMSDNYAWEPDNRYRMFHDDSALYEYWELCGYESGEFYEGTSYSEDMKHDMFKDWMEQ